MEKFLPNGSRICRNPESCDQPFAEQTSIEKNGALLLPIPLSTAEYVL